VSSSPAQIDRRCSESFGRQGLMRLIGAQLVEARDGRAVIEVEHRDDLTQQNGYFHGGVVTAIADTASGYAAFTTMPEDSSVLTVEFKINLTNPAHGERLRTEAMVRKAGRTLVVVATRVMILSNDRWIDCAELLGTFIVLRNTSDHEPRALR
jgi:uncharacterized protein (TIGR00369 family)